MTETVSYKIEFKDGATAAISNVTSKVQELGNKAAEVQKPFSALQSSMMAWNSATDLMSKFSGAIANLTGPSKAFAAEMKKTNTMMGLSGEEYANMTSQVRELSKSVPMAADSLAKGLYQVVSNGVPKDNWIAYLEASAKSAIGGCADLEKVVTVTSTIIKNYGYSWDDALKVQDKIQLTAKNGVTSFEQLAEALPTVAGSAATLGVDIDELMASFSTLTGVSGNTAEVSTQLNAVLTSLIKPSSEAAELAQQMGIQFDAASIKTAGGMKNFLDQVGQAVKAYSEKTGTIETEIYGTLFGSARAMRAILPLQGELQQKFADNVQAMQESEGTIDDAYATMSSGAGNKIQLLKNAFGEFTDFLNSKFGFVTAMFTGITGILGPLSSCIPILKAIESTTLGLAIKTKVAAAATKAWAVAQKAFNFIASLNPIGLIVAAIAAMIAIIVLCIKKYDEFGASLLLILGPIGLLVNAIMQIKAHWDSIVDAFKSDGILAGLKRIGVVLFDALLFPLQQLLEMCSKIPGIGNLAAAGAEKIHALRARLELTENESPQADKETTADGGDTTPKPEKAAGSIFKTTGIGSAIGGTAGEATSDKGGQIKNINITIDKVVEQFTVSTTNVSDMTAVKKMVAQALVDAVNDVNYAL